MLLCSAEPYNARMIRKWPLVWCHPHVLMPSCCSIAAAYGDQAHEVTRIAEQQKLGKRLVSPTLVDVVAEPHDGHVAEHS